MSKEKQYSLPIIPPIENLKKHLKISRCVCRKCFWPFGGGGETEGPIIRITNHVFFEWVLLFVRFFGRKAASYTNALFFGENHVGLWRT